jgi:hypothetical protein
MQFVFRIELKNVTEPKVWRRLSVPAGISFARFHLVIQAAFGWHNCHLYSFSQKGYGSPFFIGVPSPMDGTQTKDAKKIKLQQIFSEPKQKLVYIYDFGDDWLHTITLEKIVEGHALNATLIKGIGACPPEDCGGPWGYKELKLKVTDPKHPEYGEMVEWLGLEPGDLWDATALDFESTAKLVASV